MNDTPRTDSRVFDSDLVSASFARELERELATECAINQRNCEDWAHDHTYLQKLCREVGFSEHDVDGDKYSIRSIAQLGDMLRSKIADRERENARLREAGKALRDALAFECHKLGDIPREIDAWDALVSDLPNAQAQR